MWNAVTPPDWTDLYLQGRRGKPRLHSDKPDGRLGLIPTQCKVISTCCCALLKLWKL